MGKFICWLELHQNLSGWVQAVGALLAIFAAIFAVSMQARYAAKQDDRRTAERVRSLARTINYWRDICVKSYQVREAEMKGQPTIGLRKNFDEFNYTASEINKFALVDTPSGEVFSALSEYRSMCAPLSQFMSPGVVTPLTPAELKEFDCVIARLADMVQRLLDEAKRIAR